MTKKTISLPFETYDKLRKEKHEGESFPELMNRLLRRKKSKEKKLEDLAGVFEKDDEWDEIIEGLYEDRSRLGRM